MFIANQSLRKADKVSAQFIMPMPISELFPLLEHYPSLLKLLEMWNEQRREHAMMSRQDLDAVKLFPRLGSLHLLAAAGDNQYRYQIFGGTIGAYFGRDLPEPEKSEALSDYDTVARMKTPLFIERQRKIINRYDAQLRPTTFGKLCLPMSEDGANVSHILAGIYPRK